MTDIQTAAVVAFAIIPVAYFIDSLVAVVRHRLRIRRRTP